MFSILEISSRYEFQFFKNKKRSSLELFIFLSHDHYHLTQQYPCIPQARLNIYVNNSRSSVIILPITIILSFFLLLTETPKMKTKSLSTQSLLITLLTITTLF